MAQGTLPGVPPSRSDGILDFTHEELKTILEAALTIDKVTRCHTIECSCIACKAFTIAYELGRIATIEEAERNSAARGKAVKLALDLGASLVRRRK